jgi:hypothetical protein
MRDHIILLHDPPHPIFQNPVKFFRKPCPAHPWRAKSINSGNIIFPIIIFVTCGFHEVGEKCRKGSSERMPRDKNRGHGIFGVEGVEDLEDLGLDRENGFGKARVDEAPELGLVAGGG